MLVLMHSWPSWMDDQEWLGSQECAGNCALLSIEQSSTVANISICCHTHTLTFFALAVALIAITSTSMCCHRLAFYTAKIALLVTWLNDSLTQSSLCSNLTNHKPKTNTMRKAFSKHPLRATHDTFEPLWNFGHFWQLRPTDQAITVAQQKRVIFDGIQIFCNVYRTCYNSFVFCVSVLSNVHQTCQQHYLQGGCLPTMLSQLVCLST